MRRRFTSRRLNKLRICSSIFKNSTIILRLRIKAWRCRRLFNPKYSKNHISEKMKQTECSRDKNSIAGVTKKKSMIHMKRWYLQSAHNDYKLKSMKSTDLSPNDAKAKSSIPNTRKITDFRSNENYLSEKRNVVVSLLGLQKRNQCILWTGGLCRARTTIKSWTQWIW